ncbi:hypothetical protein [Pseudoxanthomonas sp. PXM01]|uniref:hypothetical protein n=1 Tax=Pseudoxanthomonas sp. PXM01 TaxID=2769295 RepID=UPI0017867242|nr:hypothetical protein [Pseudoxanthomonas sp. PXM01]MBD9468777.1 hypothetical protein [Pseudoxanthomonas sp. PXM01]
MPVEVEGEHPLPRRRSGIEPGDAAPGEEKKFAQIGAFGLVRREIRRPSGKFFLGAVQAVRVRLVGCRAIAARSYARMHRAIAKKKKRVLPMFFFRRMSSANAGCFNGRHGVAAGVAAGRRPPAPASKKKLREGVDT